MGITIAITIILVWGFHLFYSLNSVIIEPGNSYVYLHVLIQGFLYTGLFITGHDAMHKTVAEGLR
jgi:beta-carotene ketolase (CrtW type)